VDKRIDKETELYEDDNDNDRHELDLPSRPSRHTKSVTSTASTSNIASDNEGKSS
jgi:hypothetical protein